jgi:hypothetical protein
MKSLDHIRFAEGEVESLETIIVGPALLASLGLADLKVGEEFTCQGRVHRCISRHSGISEHGRFFTFHFSSKEQVADGRFIKPRLTGIVMDGGRLRYLGE